MAEKTRAMGLRYMGLSDHSKAAVVGGLPRKLCGMSWILGEHGFLGYASQSFNKVTETRRGSVPSRVGIDDGKPVAQDETAPLSLSTQ